MGLLDMLSKPNLGHRCFEQALLALPHRPYATDLGVVQVAVAAVQGLSVLCQDPRSRGGLQKARLKLPGPSRRSRRAERPHLLKLGDAYFVDQGHHQVWKAIKRRQPAIQARVTDYVEPAGDISGLLRHAQQHVAERTGLAEIDLPSPQAYEALLKQIKEHHAYLERTGQCLLRFDEAVRDWQRAIYRPMVAGLQAAGLDERSPDEVLERITYFVGRLARQAQVPLSQVLLQVITTDLPWGDKIQLLLPPCQYQGRCPYLSASPPAEISWS